MYTEYFNLKEKPFKLTPDPRFLYLNEKSNKTVTTIGELFYTVRERVGFAVVIGEVGTGKTTICRTFVNHIHRLKDKYQLAYIFNPSFDDMELYQTINKELGVESNLGSRSMLHNALINHLLKQKEAGISVILLIDEAQNLAPSVLEQIRLLSNLETESQKLIQIILVGQPELSKLLRSKSMRQLNQRISVRCYIEPLKFGEMINYIRHRLKVAGGEHLINIFTYPALRYIYFYTQGTPRLVNIVCDRALLACYSMSAFKIPFRVVWKAINQSAGFYSSPRRFRKTSLSFIFTLLILFSGYVLISSKGINPVQMVKSAILSDDGLGSNGGKSGFFATVVQCTKDVLAKSDEVKPVVKAKAAVSKLVVNSKKVAVESVLKSWGVNKSISGSEASLSIEDIAAGKDFKCHVGKFKRDDLVKINYPTIIEVKGRDGKIGYLPILTVAGKDYLVDSSGKKVVSDLWLDDHWTGKAYILWKDFQSTSENIKRGDKGDSVVWVQKGLIETGHASFKPIGIYGRQTEAAVVRFQKAYGLKADGIVDSLTKIYLYKRLSGYKTPNISGSTG